MAFTVKKVAAMSGVSVRTLHYYDETSLLKPAYTNAKGYRFYEEPQLLMLQQILFYRELGFELKRIKRIVARRNFEKVAALRSHREVLQKNLARTRTLIETIDKTINHLRGRKKMKSEEMFVGFSLAAGQDRFDETLKLDGQPLDCKVSSRDTGGTMCVFEATFGWPHHLHHDQDEWIYVVDGQLEFVLGERRFRIGAGESVFIPRKVPHGWAPVGDEPCKFINVFQPAGNIEEFFRAVSKLVVGGKELPSRDQVINKTYTKEQVAALSQLFAAHGMDLLPPPLAVE